MKCNETNVCVTQKSYFLFWQVKKYKILGQYVWFWEFKGHTLIKEKKGGLCISKIRRNWFPPKH